MWNCVAKAYQCIYDFKSDRRRKTHIAELSSLHDAPNGMTAIIRQETREEVSCLFWEMESLLTDQEAIGANIGGEILAVPVRPH